MRLLTAMLLSGLVVLASAARSQGVYWQNGGSIFSRQPAVVVGDVRRYSFPRTDLKVTLDGVAIKPALALGGWVAFKQMQAQAMVMGDLVLLEGEVNPVMQKMIEGGLDITAVHKHLLRASPATYFMHIGGHVDACHHHVRIGRVISSSLSCPAPSLSIRRQRRQSACRSDRSIRRQAIVFANSSLMT